MTRFLLAVALLTVSACSTPPQVMPAPPAVAAPPEAPKPAPVVDQCGAVDLQHLIGRSRLEAPVPLRPERHRVACTTCPVALDFDETRLNILFDTGTGRITEVRCG